MAEHETPFDGERAIELLRRAASDREESAAVYRSGAIADVAKVDADVLRALADLLPALLDAGKDAASVDFLTTHCAAIVLRDSEGAERWFEREYFSEDDSFRDFLAQIPAEYERVTIPSIAARSAAGEGQHGAGASTPAAPGETWP